MNFKAIFPLLLVSLSALSAAQQGPPPRDLMLTKKVFLALSPKIASEIKLTPEERSRVLDAFGGALEVDGNRVSLRLTGDQDMVSMESEALKVLDKPQQKRLQEVWIQYLKGLALADDGIAKLLNLTPDQKKATDSFIEQGGTDLAEFMTTEPSAENAKKIDEVRAKFGKRILALLTEDQKRTFDDLQGKPFDFSTKSKEL